MNKFAQNVVSLIVLTLAIVSISQINASPIIQKSLHKRSVSDLLYHQKNICILACGQCADDDLNNLNEEVTLGILKIKN